MRLTQRATDGRYIPRFLTESCLAHKRLDEAVFAAYGWNSDLSDEEILEKLLALNLERSGRILVTRRVSNKKLGDSFKGQMWIE